MFLLQQLRTSEAVPVCYILFSPGVTLKEHQAGPAVQDLHGEDAVCDLTFSILVCAEVMTPCGRFICRKY